jgi:hypothetical protein
MDTKQQLIENIKVLLVAEDMENSINSSGKLLKEEKVAEIARAGAQRIHQSRSLLSKFERSLKEQRGKLAELLSIRSLKPVYPLTEVGQLKRLGDLFLSFLFKAEIKALSERNYIRLFEKKWNEGDLFAVKFMLDCAEEILGPAAYVRFTEQYKKLSAEGFSTEEKNALTSIKHYEAEIKALEAFLKKNIGNE